MSSRAVRLLIALLLVALVSYAFLLNPDVVAVNLGGGRIWRAPLALVLIGTFCLGIFMTAVVSFFIGAGLSYHHWREKKQYLLEAKNRAQLVSIREQIELGEVRKAEERLRSILLSTPSETLARIMLCELLQQEQRGQEALRVLDGIKTQGSDNAALLFLAASAFESSGNLSAAYDQLALLNQSFPNNQRVLQSMLSLSQRLTLWPQALETAQRLFKLTPVEGQQQLQEQIAWIQLQELKGRYSNNQVGPNKDGSIQAEPAQDEIVEPLEALLRKHREYAPALELLAQREERAKRYDAATKLYQRAFKSSNSTSYLEDAIRCLILQEEPTRALQIARAAKSSTPTSREIQMVLTALLIQLGMLEEASLELQTLDQSLVGVGPIVGVGAATITGWRELNLAAARAGILNRIERVRSDDSIPFPGQKLLQLSFTGTKRIEGRKGGRVEREQPSPQLSTP